MTGTPGRLRGLPAALSLGAAAIHFAAAPAHFGEFPPFGVAFAALGWFQTVWAVASLQGPSPRARLLAIAVNGAAVGIWVVSRSVGLPFGPAPGEAEAVGVADALATAFEVVLVLVLLLGPQRLPTAGAPRLTPTFGAMLAAAALVASVGVAAAASAHADHHHDAPPATPEPTAAPSTSAPVAPTPTAVAPSTGVATPAATASPAPPSADPDATNPAPGEAVQIQFGTRLGSGGDLYETGFTFAIGQTVVWRADLSAPVGPAELRFQVVQRLADGREFIHWDEAFVAHDPAATQIVAAGDLALFAHGGPGTYLVRYLRGRTLVAEGIVTLTPPG